MKKTLLTIATLTSMMAFGQTQMISDKGALDLFLDGSEFVAGVDPVSVETDKIKWDVANNAPVPTEKAYKGIFWWVGGGLGALNFTSERKGDGKLSYTITQNQGEYKPFGVGFGEYAESATATQSSYFTLDLSTNANVEVKYKNKSGKKVKVTLQLQDITGKSIGTLAAFLDDPADGNLWKYDIKQEILATDTSEQVFAFDFSTANGSEYIANPNSAFGCNDLAVRKTIAETAFDYTKVKALAITIVDITSQLTAAECYGRPEMADAKFEITGFKIGDVTVGVNDPTISKSFANENITVYNMLGAVVATGTLETLSLENGFYIFKSATQTQKVIIK